MKRRLAAILAADVVGYSRLMGEDETGTLARLKALRRELVQPKIAEHRGRIAKLMGDGLLAEFSSVVDAVQCAVEIQQSMVGHEAGLPDQRRIRLRIGINLGDVMVEGSDLYGDGVNVAARLEALAEPGGIYLSGTAFDTVDGKVELSFEDVGERKVKNIAKPVRVYRIACESPSEQSYGFSNTPLPLPDKPSVAVLPFVNMSGDSEQDYFSDGITEDIITELSRFRTLFVIARNSSFAYKGQTIDVKRIARELGVRFVLEGSIRRAGPRVRITAQLIDSESGNHIWAERYDRDVEDIFSLQEDITRSVVGAMAPQIELAEVERSRKLSGKDLTAYELALKAQALFYDSLRMGRPEVQQQAIDITREALRLDPRNLHALWIQAISYYVQFLYRWHASPKDALDFSLAAVERIFEIDSSNPHGYMMRGINHHFRGDFEAAVADFRRAFALNPNLAVNIILMAFCESLAGYTDEAKEHARLGLRLSPRDDEIWLGTAYLALAQASFADGDYEETEKWATLAIQMHPRAPIRRTLMIACCTHKGDLKKAEEHKAFLESFAPDFIPSVLGGDMKLYKMPQHNASLVEGLRKAGSSD